ncbi:MAG: signal recognition particle-docking protein FtsY [Planctomycetes bacterium]|nr:signal recognition particle-docking protein FtsY [Planctomycetota bacterium]
MVFGFFRKKEKEAPAPEQAPPPVAAPAAEPPAEPEPEKKGFLKKLTRAISKTRMILSRRVLGLVGLGQKIDDAILEKLEEAMIEADFGVETTDFLMQLVRKAWKASEIETTDQILPYLRKDLHRRLTHRGNAVHFAQTRPTVILVVGVNGAGKTTSVAKLAWWLRRQGKSVVLAAADTFRAAAVEQLRTWGQRIGCEVVTGADRADPASVAHRAAERVLELGSDVLLVDTAGRLHTQKNLMDELRKIYMACAAKRIAGAPHETILVLDATTGQNALNQAQMFKQAAEVTGLFLAKLDGTAKGGAVLTINEKVEVPVKFVGLGEKMEDVQLFDADQFVEALFDLEDLKGQEAS